MMKKTIALLVALCIILGAGVGILVYRAVSRNAEPAPAETAAPETAEVPEDTDEPAGLDFAAMRALYDDDEVVMTIDGQEIKWSEYFYWMSYNATMIQNYVGAVDDWNAEFYDGLSYAQYVRDAVEDNCRQYHTLETFAKDKNLSLSEDDLQAIADQRAYDISNYCGEGGTEEDFAAYLAGLNMTPEIYDYISSTYQLYQSGFAQLYGENGENCPDELIQSFLEENGFMNANHILFMTIDPATGEKLEEEVIAEKLEQAQALVDKLRAITEIEELLAHFEELKEEYCEDTGKAAYPHGYVFTHGTMVEEFENGVLSLGDYEVSDPIESSYGYHIILRLPLSLVTAQTVVDMQYGYTADYAAAISTYTKTVESYIDNAEVRYKPGFENFSIADIA